MPSFTVRLTTSGTIYNILTLVRDLVSTYVDRYPQIIITSDVDNTVPVYIGGSAVSATDYGFRLAGNDDSVNIGSGQGHACLKGLYAIAAANNQDLNIQCF